MDYSIQFVLSMKVVEVVSVTSPTYRGESS